MATAASASKRTVHHLAHHATRLTFTRLPRSTLLPRMTASTRTLTVPAGAWDAHTHVADTARFPPSSAAVYKVHTATLAQARAHAARIGVPHQVLVQTSTYGTDNAWILACLRELGAAAARGVVVVPPPPPSPSDAGEAHAPSAATLHEWHALGVRGLRLNFTSVGARPSPARLAALLRAHAALIRPLRTWVLDLYLPLALVPAVAPLVEELGVKVVFAHLGDPPAGAAQREGWAELLGALRHPRCYVKISAPYRFTEDPEFRALEPLVRELLAVRDGKAAVFASDWPHTRFEDTDIAPWVTRCLEWCDGDESLALKLFKTNAETLYDVQ